jgi:hypothetical protein
MRAKLGEKGRDLKTNEDWWTNNSFHQAFATGLQCYLQLNCFGRSLEAHGLMGWKPD